MSENNIDSKYKYKKTIGIIVKINLEPDTKHYALAAHIKFDHPKFIFYAENVSENIFQTLKVGTVIEWALGGYDKTLGVQKAIRVEIHEDQTQIIPNKVHIYNER